MADVLSFCEEMSNAAADWQLNVYGQAMHGFTHEDAMGRGTPGVAYNAVADRRSAAALRDFLFELFNCGRNTYT
jgi:dienelactone hydrolase